MWITRASGQIRLITPWQMPAKSSDVPKSDRNVTNGACSGSVMAETLVSPGEQALDRRDQPFHGVRVGLGQGLDPVLAQRRRGHWADRRRREAVEAAVAERRREARDRRRRREGDQVG